MIEEMGILVVGFIIARMLSSGGTSFSMTPAGMGLLVAYFILVHLFNIGTGAIFLETRADVGHFEPHARSSVMDKKLALIFHTT